MTVMCILRHVNHQYSTLYQIQPPLCFFPTTFACVCSRTDRSEVFRMRTSSSKMRQFPCVKPLGKISVPCIHNNLASISIRTPPITTSYRSPFQNELILNLKVHGQPFVLQHPKNTPRGPHRALTPLSELHGQTLSPNLNCTTSSKPS